MLILGLETATPWGSLALCEDDQIIFEVSLRAGRGGGEYLLSLLDGLLAKSGREMAEIGLVAVGNGPGSYTGIRVGLAAAQGLAAALAIPAVGINTLRIIAENAALAAEWVAPMIDARRGEIYAALYQRATGGLLEVIAPEAISAAKFRERLATLPEVMLAGDASKAYPEIWSAGTNLKIAPPAWDRPLAGQAGLIGGTLAKNSGLGLDPDQLRPAYLRRVEAEIRLEELQRDSND
jgi:tRNA threonylcarbamoyladenosine biosynthesis protein TsaB